jgi:hypothetical protein
MLLVIIGIFLFSSIAYADQIAFWTEPGLDDHINSLSIEKGENKTIRFKADVPSEKTLIAYSFTVEYNSNIVSVEAIV